MDGTDLQLFKECFIMNHLETNKKQSGSSKRLTSSRQLVLSTNSNTGRHFVFEFSGVHFKTQALQSILHNLFGVSQLFRKQLNFFLLDVVFFVIPFPC